MKYGYLKSGKNAFKKGDFDSNGFTLIEVITVIAIFVLISALFLGTFFSLRDYRTLERDAAETRAYLEEARIYTQGSRDDSSYGVRFEDNFITLFKGNSWITREEEIRSYSFGGSTEILMEGIGNTEEIVFERLFGEPSVSGEILLSGKERDITVTVLPGGFIE